MRWPWAKKEPRYAGLSGDDVLEIARALASDASLSDHMTEVSHDDAMMAYGMAMEALIRSMPWWWRAWFYFKRWLDGLLGKRF